jgi:hypothetical protein
MNIQELARNLIQSSKIKKDSQLPGYSQLAGDTSNIASIQASLPDNPVVNLLSSLVMGNKDKNQQIAQAYQMSQQGQQIAPEQADMINKRAMDMLAAPAMGMAAPKGRAAKIDGEFLAMKDQVNKMPIEEIKKMSSNLKPDDLYNYQVKKAISEYMRSLDFIPDKLPDDILDKIIATVSRYGA